MVNYAKWDNVGDSSDDEAPTQLAQEVENKLAVTPPQAPSRNPQAEVLTDRANRVVNTLIERHGEDKARLVGPDERAAYREACTLYDAAFKAIDVEDAKLSSRILLNLATCHWQINEFAQARKASASALEFDNADDKGRARDIVNACDRELRQVAATKDGVDHAQAGNAALHAKDFAAGAKHFAALAEAFSGSGGEDEIHALAHLALCYEQQSRFDEAALSYDRAAEACGHQDDASVRVPRRAQLAQRAQKCYEQCGQDAKAAASCARETGRCVNDPELALKCAGAFAQRYRKEKKVQEPCPAVPRRRRRGRQAGAQKRCQGPEDGRPAVVVRDRPGCISGRPLVAASVPRGAGHRRAGPARVRRRSCCGVLYLLRGDVVHRRRVRGSSLRRRRTRERARILRRHAIDGVCVDLPRRQSSQRRAGR
jgi:tetratricopeptide (TPR) repeat protein